MSSEKFTYETEIDAESLIDTLNSNSSEDDATDTVEDSIDKALNNEEFRSDNSFRSDDSFYDEDGAYNLACLTDQ